MDAVSAIRKEPDEFEEAGEETQNKPATRPKEPTDADIVNRLSQAQMKTVWGLPALLMFFPLVARSIKNANTLDVG